MSYRTSNVPIYGLGTMPGSSNISTYPSTRKYGSTASMHSFSNTSRPISRPLPIGAGPLDHTGRKLSSYTSSDTRKPTTVRGGPLRADHSYGSKYEYTPSIGSLTRQYSPHTAAFNSTTKDTALRSIRARSVSHTDRLTDSLSNVKLNGYDSVKSPTRTIDLDDSLYVSRESRKDRHETNLNDSNIRTGSRVSRLSNGTNDDVYTTRNRDITSRAPSIQRDNDNKRKESISDIGATKPLSRQSSSSSISTVSFS